MEKTVFNGSVKYIQVMDENGNIDKDLYPKDLTDKDLVELYKYMNLGREMSDKLVALQRAGLMPTIVPIYGEEATQAGSAYALTKDDWIIPTFRQHLSLIIKGVSIYSIFLYFKGYEEGFQLGAVNNSGPEIAPVGAGIPHAAGVAFSLKYKKKPNVVLTYVGDGGTSEGDFYEGMNFAGVNKVPLVTIIEDNEWAISVPRSQQTAAETLAQKAFAVGMDTIQVDGNDVLAVYKATKDAIDSIKKGGRPYIIEALTYRMGMHTTADDPTKYRPESEVDPWKPKDPITRMKKYLVSKKLWNDDMEAKMKEEHNKLLDDAMDKIKEFKPDPKSIFETALSFMPDSLKEEEDEAVKNNFWQ
ncbi:2-oxoacid dehydrogenase multienzyme complex, 2-oxoacid decarboxylase (E1) component subunit alpha [Candidatus Mancarchaeum acidiphilum]|uniref:2-oxoacid dehydrogenase multienzyme complex, 2-oxoacid decarboxylase (E1) component subunit alpha n=1 Tax=Candidatus Mancarchaeum acidiphilum TaxID=1920749 RepID=A0A218NN40_9ARCH|nr:thiamine pyrophosphate-dependent dehydrogenase E1 component subunit alpha [Candidatus Mancarchaeum acidiphilum]ASI13864.1 2-oxoacid dehydrogenase multienzyme complex, 2-oxoacid decarboxylase (E1) component subunit alpha [Candidatus Mancarchaeum acidiphilum]